MSLAETAVPFIKPLKNATRYYVMSIEHFFTASLAYKNLKYSVTWDLIHQCIILLMLQLRPLGYCATFYMKCLFFARFRDNLFQLQVQLLHEQRVIVN